MLWNLLIRSKLRRTRAEGVTISSIGTVNKRNPIISELLYQTTSAGINVPVKMPFTIKKRNQNDPER